MSLIINTSDVKKLIKHGFEYKETCNKYCKLEYVKYDDFDYTILKAEWTKGEKNSIVRNRKRELHRLGLYNNRSTGHNLWPDKRRFNNEKRRFNNEKRRFDNKMKREDFKQGLINIVKELEKTKDDEKAYSEANELTIQFLKELEYVEEAEILENIGVFYG